MIDASLPEQADDETPAPAPAPLLPASPSETLRLELAQFDEGGSSDPSAAPGTGQIDPVTP